MKRPCLPAEAELELRRPRRSLRWGPAGDGGADAGAQRLTGACGSERERESLSTMAIDGTVFCGCSYKDADAAAAER